MVYVDVAIHVLNLSNKLTVSGQLAALFVAQSSNFVEPLSSAVQSAFKNSTALVSVGFFVQPSPELSRYNVSNTISVTHFFTELVSKQLVEENDDELGNEN